jgi:hypothetical protein
VTAANSVQLRFFFDAPKLRAAVDLANTLRMGQHDQVQVRPAPRRLLTAGRWSVILTTPPSPLLHAVIELWEEQMRDVVASHAGCSLVGWKPLLAPSGIPLTRSG